MAGFANGAGQGVLSLPLPVNVRSRFAFCRRGGGIIGMHLGTKDYSLVGIENAPLATKKPF